MSRFILFIVSVFINVTLFAQNSNWINYTSQEWIHQILEDENNYWITTGGGIGRIDKSANQTYLYTKAKNNLLSNNIGGSTIDDEGNFWCSPYNYPLKEGISMWDGSQFIHTDLSHDDFNMFRINAMAFDKENYLWFAAGKYLVKYKNGVYDYIQVDSDMSPIDDNIRNLIVDEYNNLWILWYNPSRQVTRINNGDLNSMERYFSSPLLHKDKSGFLWMLKDSSLVCFDGNENPGSGIEFKHDIKLNYIPEEIWEMGIDSKDNIYLLGLFELVLFNIHKPENIVKVQKPDSVTLFNSILVDEEVLIGSSDGLFRFAGDSLVKIKLSDIDLPDNTASLFALSSNNDVWITYNDQIISRINQNLNAFNTYNLNNFSLDNSFKKLFDDEYFTLWSDNKIAIQYYEIQGSGYWRVSNIFKGSKSGKIKVTYDSTIWIASDTGLVKISDNIMTTYNMENSYLNSNSIAQIFIDYNNNLLVSTLPNDFNIKGKLYKKEGNSFIEVFSCQEGAEWVSSIAADKSNNIWISVQNRNGICQGNGIWKHNITSWVNYNINNSKLSSNSVTDLCFDSEDNLWITMYCGGVAKFDPSGKWTLFNHRNSPLPNDNVEIVEVDSNDNIWISVKEGGITFIPKDSSPIENIEVKKHNAQLEIYPNPTSDEIFLKLQDTSIIPYSLHVFDLSGKELGIKGINNYANGMYAVSLSEFKINQNGLFLLRINTNKGTFYSKLIIY